MTYKHYNAAVDMPYHYDSGTQRAIFLESCYRADNKGVIRIGQSELAAIMLYSPATVKREFARLQEIGLLDKQAHGRYLITLPHEEPVYETKVVTIIPDTLEEWLNKHETSDKDFGEVVYSVSEGEVIPIFIKEIIENEELRKAGIKYTRKGKAVTYKSFHLNSESE